LEILEADVKIEEIAEPVSISTLQNNIEFKDIGFYYDKANLILKNFNLTIPKENCCSGWTKWKWKNNDCQSFSKIL
jgi:ABC-type bacteriocin/lantibiotic exporter with double-glycine peptidase domain